MDSTHFDPPTRNHNTSTRNCVVRKRNIRIDTTTYWS
uniref:NdhA n=1 Tax=Arundo donax TaxID=35708 RepID=A0A0A8Z8W3_ARUDO